MPINQRTLNREKSIKGKALHTGEDVTLTLKPAPASSGFVFGELIFTVNQKLSL